MQETDGYYARNRWFHAMLPNTMLVLLLALIYVSVCSVLVFGKNKDVVVDVSALEMRNLDVSPNKSHFDLEADGCASFLVNQRLDELHSIVSLFQFQCNEKTLFGVFYLVVVTVWGEFEFAGILVFLV